MRILMITNLYPCPPGALDDIALPQMRASAYMESGHEVKIISGRKSKRTQDPNVLQVLDVIPNVFGEDNPQRMVLNFALSIPVSLRNQAAVEAVLAQWVPDVVDIACINSVSIFSVLPIVRAGIPLVVNLGDDALSAVSALNTPSYRNLIRILGGVDPNLFLMMPTVVQSRSVRDKLVEHGYSPRNLALVGSDDTIAYTGLMESGIRAAMTEEFEAFTLYSLHEDQSNLSIPRAA